MLKANAEFTSAISARLAEGSGLFFQRLTVSVPDLKSAVDFWTSDLTAEYVRLNSEYTT